MLSRWRGRGGCLVRLVNLEATDDSEEGVVDFVE